MEGLVIRSVRKLAWHQLVATAAIHPPISFRACTAIVLRQLKKGAGVRLTSPERLRHNPFARKYLHGERVLAQPMASE